MKKRTRLEPVSEIVRGMFLSILTVAVLNEITDNIANFSAGLCISRFFGEKAVASLSVASPIFSIIGVFSGVLASGIQAVVSSELGRGKRENANRIYSLSLLVSLGIGLVVGVAGCLFSEQLAIALGAKGASAELLYDAKMYITGVLLGAPFQICSVSMLPIINLDGAYGIAKTGLLIYVCFDVLLSVLFGAYTELGMFGMGLASAVSFFLSVVPIFVYLFGKKSGFAFTLKGADIGDIGRVFVKGAPKATKRVCKTFKPVLINTMLGAIGGSAALAALGVQQNFRGIVEVAGAGMTAAVLPLVSIFDSDRDDRSIKDIIRIAGRYTVCVIFPISALMIIFAPRVAALYNITDATTVAQCIFALRTYAIALPLISMNQTYYSYLQAVGMDVYSNIGVVLHAFLSPVICGFVLIRIMGTTGFWISVPVGELLTFFCFRAVATIKLKRPALSMADVLMMPLKYTNESKKVYISSINNTEEAIRCSEDIGRFCRENGVNSRESFYASLFSEELCVNTIEECFSSDRKNHLEIKVWRENELLKIRVRDDCTELDAVERCEVNYKSSDPCENLGIRIVEKMADSMETVNVMKVNNILVTVKCDNATE